MFKNTLRYIAVTFMVISLLPALLIGDIGFEYIMSKYGGLGEEKHTMIANLMIGHLNNTVLAILCLVVIFSYSLGIVCICMDIKKPKE